jgi:HAD superfamily hydrolase (TIGR01509 family)
MGSLADAIAAAGAADAWCCDLDGTLADTMPLHFDAYAAVIAAQGGALTREAYDAIVGPPARVTIPLFLAASGLDPIAHPTDIIHAAKKAALAERLAGASLPRLPVAEMVAGTDLPVAVVTSGNRSGAQAILAALGIADRITLLVASEDYVEGKPDPEPYLTAAVKLGLAPARCLAFEDLDDGLTSARRAGMRVIDVRGLC